ncbi:hypothetical protein FOA52_009457 [Chlamydomonas sp. UWO 241]|nr:hypothetical protein FOA52_009457 [Chlamydomonas sp. UWO 241]
MVLLTSLVDWARGSAAHARVRAVRSERLVDVRRPDVNVVHVQRPRLALPAAELRTIVASRPTLRVRAAVPTTNPRPHLEAALKLPLSGGRGVDAGVDAGVDVGVDAECGLRAAREFLVDDIARVVEAFGEDLGYTRVNVKLEVIANTKCPKWHADHVGLRLLCTYVGDGTLYVDNAHATRSWVWSGGAMVPVVAGVDEGGSLQAATGDLLLLKGHGWGDDQGGGSASFMGLGAVHRSPDVPEPGAGTRLLLTVDDVLQDIDGCGCGAQH